MASVEQDSTETVAVELGIDADVWVEVDEKGRQTLVLHDETTEVRMAVPPMAEGNEFPYLHVRRLAARIEAEATEVNRNSLGWHGPVNGPGGWT